MYTPQDRRSRKRRFFCLAFLIAPSGGRSFQLQFLFSSLPKQLVTLTLSLPPCLPLNTLLVNTELLRALLPGPRTLGRLNHTADEINPPVSKPIFPLRDRTHHGECSLFEWAVRGKLSSYRFYYILSASKFKVNIRNVTVSHPRIEFVEAEKQLFTEDIY